MTASGSDEKRVVHILGALVAGGAERYVVELLIALKKLGYNVELVCLLPKRDAVGEKWAGKLEDAGVKILPSGPTEKMTFRTAWWLSRVLREPGIDIVHVHLHYCESAYYAARFLHRRRYRVLRTVHNTPPPETPRMAWAFRFSDIMYSVTCGDATHKAYTEEDINTRGRVKCVPYGVTFDWPVHDASQREPRLKALGLDPEHTHYVQIGRQTAQSIPQLQKAQDDLIAAWRSQEMGAKGGRLHFLGTGNLQDELKKLAGGDESIIFHGVVANAHEWLGGADTYVMPSRWEGLPLAGIEAVGTGIPCIFSDIAPHHELNCSAAWFAPVGDIDRLGELLVERLGKFDDAPEADVQKLRDRFGIESSAKMYADAYEEL